MITMPDHLLPEGHREVVETTKFGDIETYAPRTGDIDLSLTPDQTAAKLQEQEANAQMVAAASESVAKAYQAADAAKHEQM
jgi:hypothetical protein